MKKRQKKTYKICFSVSVAVFRDIVQRLNQIGLQVLGVVKTKKVRIMTTIQSKESVQDGVGSKSVWTSNFHMVQPAIMTAQKLVCTTIQERF